MHAHQAIITARRSRLSLPFAVLGGLILSPPLLAQRPGEAPRAGAAVLHNQGARLSTEDPADDDQAFRRALAQQTMRDNCLICHSEEIINSQRLTQAQWKAEVDKMVGWGAPLPVEQAPLVVEFLAQSYSGASPEDRPARVGPEHVLAQARAALPSATLPTGDADRGGKLYAAYCATCHGVSGQGADLGPNLVETMVLVRPEEYADIVQQGRRRMPGFRSVLKSDQASDILHWLRNQRYRVAAAP